MDLKEKPQELLVLFQWVFHWYFFFIGRSQQSTTEEEFLFLRQTSEVLVLQTDDSQHLPYQTCYLHAGFLPAALFLCQFLSQISSLAALLLAPCCPIICFIVCGLYLSTHSRVSPPLSGTLLVLQRENIAC